MAEIINFKNEKILKSVRKILSDDERMSAINGAIENYKFNLYVYSLGQANTEYVGRVLGAEEVLYTIGIDCKLLREEVRQKIQDEGKEIKNDLFFTGEI